MTGLLIPHEPPPSSRLSGLSGPGDPNTTRGAGTPAQHARAAPPIPADWIALVDLVDAPLPAATRVARERALRREAERLSRVFIPPRAMRYGARWFFDPRADVCGRPAALWRSAPAALAGLPPGHEGWTDRDRERYLATELLLEAWDAFRSRWRGPRDDATLGAAFAAAPLDAYTSLSTGLSVAAWCATQRLMCTPRRVRDYRDRLRTDGNVDRRGVRGGTPVAPSPDAWALFRSLYLTEQRRSVKLCWEIVGLAAAEHAWVWPALRTIQLRVHEELPPPIADKHRLGERAWERKYGPRIVRDLSATRPNQVWVGDHCEFDLVVTDAHGRPVRPWLTAWMDQRSRVVVGWRITTGPDSDTILGAFAAGVREHGAPLEVLIDNGKDYRAKTFSRGRRRILDVERANSICERLAIKATFAEAFNPGAKAIERFFGTMHARFDKLFGSYCGRNPQERPEEFYKHLRAGRIDVPTLGELQARFVAWLATDYHRQPHDGEDMHGLAPLEVFANCDPLPRRTAPEHLLDLLLSRHVRVTVTKHGVRYREVHYGQGAPELFRWIGREVFVRIDPARADRVEVADDDGRHICWAYQQRLSGLDHADLKTVRQRRRAVRRIADAARGGAFIDARKTVVDLAQDLRQAQLDQAEPLRAAAGAEQTSVRDLQMLPAAAATALHGPRPDLGAPVLRDQYQTAIDLLSTPPRRAPEKDDAPPCQADLLMGFGHAG